jgi:hypothetical protein
MPLFDVLDKEGAAVPLQKAGIGLKAGVVSGFMLIDRLPVQPLAV